jgi:hypothetical protein
VDVAALLNPQSPVKRICAVFPDYEKMVGSLIAGRIGLKANRSGMRSFSRMADSFSSAWLRIGTPLNGIAWGARLDAARERWDCLLWI